MLIMVNMLIIRYCCGKQCELLLNRFLIRDLHHKLDLLSFTSFFYNDDKIRPPPLFQPRVEKISTPQLVSQPPPKEKFRPPHLLLDNSNTDEGCSDGHRTGKRSSI